MGEGRFDQAAQEVIAAGHQQLDALQRGNRQRLVGLAVELQAARRHQHELLAEQRLQVHALDGAEAVDQGHVEAPRHHQLAQHVAETVADIQHDVGMLLGKGQQQRSGELSRAAERRQPD